MTPLIRVGPRAAPVLLEEHPQSDLRGVEVVLRIEGEEDLVLAHQLIEARHDGVKRLVATDFVVERALRLCHATIVSCQSVRRLGRWRHLAFIGLTCEHVQNCRAIDGDPW
jgi:hypothetical protein